MCNIVEAYDRKKFHESENKVIFFFQKRIKLSVLILLSNKLDANKYTSSHSQFRKKKIYLNKNLLVFFSCDLII